MVYILTFLYIFSAGLSTSKTSLMKKAEANWYPKEMAELPVKLEDPEHPFYENNKYFWYAEAAYPFFSPYTTAFGKEFQGKYIMDKTSFLKRFRNADSIDLVILRGPNLIRDMSGDILTVRRLGNEGYLLSRISFINNRFCSKQYTRISHADYEEMYAYLQKLRKETKQQLGGPHRVPPEVFEGCIGDISDAADKSRTYLTCLLRSSSGMVINNVDGTYFLLHGYGGIVNETHPRQVIYRRIRHAYLDEPLRQVHWQSAYEERMY